MTCARVLLAARVLVTAPMTACNSAPRSISRPFNTQYSVYRVDPRRIKRELAGFKGTTTQLLLRKALVKYVEVRF